MGKNNPSPLSVFPSPFIKPIGSGGFPENEVQQILYQKNIPAESLYIQLKNLKEKSAAQLKMVIGKWLDETERGAGAKIAGPNLIDPILLSFVNNNYFRGSDKGLLPDPDEKLTPHEGRESIDKPLYSMEQQRMFLKNEFAIAAALEDLDKESIVIFVEECMGQKDFKPSGNAVLPVPTTEQSEPVDKAINEGNPIMLREMLKEFEGAIVGIDKTVKGLEAVIDSIENSKDDASEASNDDPSHSKVLQKEKFEKRMRELLEQRKANVQWAKKVADYLTENPVPSADSTPGANAVQ